MRHNDEIWEEDEEYARQGSGFGSLLTGFIVGGLVGVATAFLLAPQSGAETRAQLRDKSYELRDRATSKVEDTRIKAEEAFSGARAKAVSTVDETKMKAEHVIADVKSKAGEKIQEISGRVEETARKTRQQGEELANQAEKDLDESGNM